MLCAEVTHKILRTDTVYDFLNDLYMNRPRSFHDDAIRGLVGEIVLTRYVCREEEKDSSVFSLYKLDSLVGRGLGGAYDNVIVPR